MEFLLVNHPLDCPICDQGGECDLQVGGVIMSTAGVSLIFEEKCGFSLIFCFQFTISILNLVSVFTFFRFQFLFWFL